MNESTKIIHSIPVDPLTGAISVPIYQTSTYVQEQPGVNKGFDYSRTNNPTRAILERLIAELENGKNGFAFASGLAAIDAVAKILKPGDEVLAVDDIYGGAFRLFTQVYNNFGITIKFVDTTDVSNIERKISDKTKLIWLESPTNPLLKISDIAAIAKLAKSRGCLVCVDNTFATPIIQKPIDLGVDIIIHSATKYLGGHSDLIAGLVVTNSDELGEKIKFIQNSTGGILSPFDSWLVIRGISTLSLRMKEHSNSAAAVANFLVSRPEVDKVYFPGLESHVNHNIAKTQQKYFGGMVSFSLKNDTEENAVKLATSTKLFKLAESLGGTKSLVCSPSTMTHKSIPVESRRASGVVDSLLRLSIGLEDGQDLIDDLEQAFKKL
ncbi:MAG: PLP-dependent transferase [Desulfobulbaceae bacterium]|nr:PLP-dependent transferase [Candidatus Kapabacteria bacterium]MBS3999482.1 PLP-dependent transferase [Desulfobulbaceae bacterium]